MNRDRLNEIYSGSHLRIDLNAYQHNIGRLRQLAGADRSFLAVVKANAYGHGAIHCARAAVEAGVDYLAVARIDEAIQLRRADITAPILVLGAPNTSQISIALQMNVELSVGTRSALDSIVAAGSRIGCSAKLHLKLETGLHRYGADPDLALALAQEMKHSEWVDFRGVYTHFSSADEVERSPTRSQIDIMNTFTRELKSESILPPLVHLANSAGLITGELGESTMVRAGIATYGLDPSDEVKLPEGFQPVMSLHSVISRRFQLNAGDAVSYNRTYVAANAEEVGTVPIGYADGLPRSLQGRGRVLVGGELHQILGRICMDQITIRVPDTAREGDQVIVFGNGLSGELTAEEVAYTAGTNNYETVTRMSARLPRIYYKNDEAVSWSVPLLGEAGSF